MKDFDQAFRIPAPRRETAMDVVLLAARTCWPEAVVGITDCEGTGRLLARVHKNPDVLAYHHFVRERYWKVFSISLDPLYEGIIQVAADAEGATISAESANPDASRIAALAERVADLVAGEAAQAKQPPAEEKGQPS